MKPRIRKRIGSVLERWSDGRRIKAKDRVVARLETLDAIRAKARARGLRVSQKKLSRAERKVMTARVRLGRTRRRHTSGWVGKTIRKIKGKK